MKGTIPVLLAISLFSTFFLACAAPLQEPNQEEPPTKLEQLSLHHGQIGLPLIYRHMAFVTAHLHKLTEFPGDVEEAYSTLVNTAAELDKVAQESGERTVAVCAVDLHLWTQICKLKEWPIPRAFTPEAIEEIDRLLHIAPPYGHNGGHLYFHLKSDNEQGVAVLIETIDRGLRSIEAECDIVHGNSQREGRVYGRRQLHGLISAVDAVNFSSRVLVGAEDAAHLGSCFCLTQAFKHDWEAIERMSEIEIENMIGRDSRGNLLRDDNERSHVRRARVVDENGINLRIVNLGQPFGSAPGGSHREEGVFVSAYAKNIDVFNKTLQSMLGDQPGYILDQHFTVSASTKGNIWYVPNAAELGLKRVHGNIELPINDFFRVRSSNGLMYYNAKDYLHRWGAQPGAGDTGLSPRLMRLAGHMISRWHNNWYRHRTYPDLGHLRDHLNASDADAVLSEMSIVERKGLTNKIMLGELLTHPESKGVHPDVFRIDPNEIVVGVIPPFTLGTGVRVMRYLTNEENMRGFLVSLDETSMAGHIVPDYRKLVEVGIGGLLTEARERLESASGGEAADFFRAAILALEGVQQYFRNYGGLSRRLAAGLTDEQRFERENLEDIASRMEKLAVEPPSTFLEATQLVFGMHCCLHLIGELVSFGRLDQVLHPFIDKADDGDPEPQELMDAFWMKVGEQALMNRHYFDDWRTYGTCAIPYKGGALVPQGDKASQWVMQVTVGGYLPEDGKPRDGCNEVTRLCLRSARRIPVTAPCLSLRLTPDTPEEILREASLAVLSGGASPYFFNDEALTNSLATFGLELPMADARDYCADGCWEILVGGKSELALTYTPVLAALEATLNQGATYVSAGPTYLRGDNISFESAPTEEIDSFEMFLDLFYRHYHYQAAKCLNGLLQNYGALWEFCPSPLLSTLVDGCIEAGRDLTNGGARYHLFAPQILGVPCTVDSLWAIKKMVFDQTTAVTTLTELRDCLMCDWGYSMIEPIVSQEGGKERSDIRSMRFRRLRETALALPKLGCGHRELDRFAGRVASQLGKIFMDILADPEASVGRAFADLVQDRKDRYSLSDRLFGVKLTPGFGSFEDYLGLGQAAGASADGRRKAATLSSNMSPMPSPSDLPPQSGARDVHAALAGYNGETFEYAMQMAGPVDIDIGEDFRVDALVELLRQFARNEVGFNSMSISCADRETLERAIQYPERYDLLRLRMGGWSEFFDTMFPAHQQQHLRRPMFAPPAYEKDR